MGIEYVRRINFQYREMMVDKLGKIDNKQCFLELFKYVHTKWVPYTVKEAGIFFTLNDLEQRIVYKLHEIISKYEQPDRK